MTEIVVEWKSGEQEAVDTAETEAEALYLVDEYRMAFNADAVNRIFIREERD